jgi:hypothetical protein
LNEFLWFLSFYIHRSRRPPSAPTTSSWAGRVTKPQPFCLTNSVTMNNIHRKKCTHQIQEEKIQKEIDDELMLNRSFKGKYYSIVLSNELN